MGLKDPDVLMWACAHHRILLSHDKRSMPGHFYDLLSRLAPGEQCPGAMLVPRDSGIGCAIDAVLAIWECGRHEEWRDLFTRLPL